MTYFLRTKRNQRLVGFSLGMIGAQPPCVSDLVYLLLTGLFFAIAIAYVRGCSRLWRQSN